MKTYKKTAGFLMLVLIMNICSACGNNVEKDAVSMNKDTYVQKSVSADFLLADIRMADEELKMTQIPETEVSANETTEVKTISEDTIVEEETVSEDSVSEDIICEEEEEEPEEEPLPPVTNMIIDTDMGSDADDAAAVRVATQMAKQGRVNLLAVMSSATTKDYPMCCHALLCYDGFPDVPIGYTTHECELDAVYTYGLSIPYFDEASYRLSESTELYKALLRDLKSRGETCTIVVLGFLVNIDTLIHDPEGYELVRDVVDCIWFDGGVYPGRGTDFNFCWRGNVTGAAMYVTDNCPCPVIYVTNATGTTEEYDVIKCGRSFPELDPYNVDPVHIAYNAMENDTTVEDMFPEFAGDPDLKKDLSKGHFAYDAITVFGGALTTSEDTAMLKAASLPKGQSQIPLMESQLLLQPIEAHIYENGCNEFFPVAVQSNRYMVFRQIYELDWYEDQMDYWINMGIR